MAKVDNLCILGGTHGDEMSGIWLLKKWDANSDLIRRSNFATKTLIANPEGVRLSRRYCDCDLNRLFTEENYETAITSDTPYEVRRAIQLKHMFSESGDVGMCDFLLDLHNTTANMKVCLIYATPSDFVLHLLKYVGSKMPENVCKNLYWPGPITDTVALANDGIAVEVGPQPQRVLREDILQLQEQASYHCLNFVEAFNSGIEFDDARVTVYETVEHVKFPRDSEGNINAVIHSSLQDNDWSPIQCSDPVFRSFDGKVLRLRDVVTFALEQNEILYPCFINEAAYYEKDIAFFITKKNQVSVSKLKKN